MDVHNDLMGDPEIRERYQVWHYLYPTNLPIIENARTFRMKLDELHDYLTSNGNHKVPNMVVISHSMGGILTRTAVVQNSDTFRQYIFDNPDKLKELPEEVQKELDSYVNFSRKPYISRVIFVAVPHRGSDIADNWIGSIGRWLMSLPAKVVDRTTSLAKGVRNLIKPSLRSEFDNEDRSSIRGLSRKNPTLIGLSQTPIDPAVPFHSIIGDQGKGNGVESSDGVVTYDSSHVDGAQSELIVPADHSAHSHPKAIQEIRRILRLHLGIGAER
jgi:triacylglycerol esterase/lipase EstA (alpha/beta hydrolase family)